VIVNRLKLLDSDQPLPGERPLSRANRDAIPFVFDRALFIDEKARAAEVKILAKREVTAMKAKIEDLQRLGIGEAATFISNARLRFETQTPAGFNDCKTNCRSAIISLLTRLTGEADPRVGIRYLAKQRIFGDREEMVIDVCRSSDHLDGLAMNRATGDRRGH